MLNAIKKTSHPNETDPCVILRVGLYAKLYYPVNPLIDGIGVLTKRNFVRNLDTNG